MDADAAQLELFGTTLPQAAIRRRNPVLGNLRLRDDHVILLTIAGLLAVTVVFAMGVERGKQVARAERPLLAPATPATQMTPEKSTTQADKTVESERSLQPPASVPASPTSPPTPRSIPRKAEKTTVAATPGFAIQVVSYRKPDLARREMQRLQQRGEPAFLVMKQGFTVLCVGPFPSRENARTKLSHLKKQYGDCFIRSL